MLMLRSEDLEIVNPQSVWGLVATVVIYLADTHGEFALCRVHR